MIHQHLWKVTSLVSEFIHVASHGVAISEG